MSNTNQKNIRRWVLLIHTGAPDDLQGIHFDLLLEDSDFCRSWRLSEIPRLDGPYVEAVSITPHKLEWLQIKEKVLSCNRGVAKRIKKGIFFRSSQTTENSKVNLCLEWEDNEVNLVIDEKGCKICSKKL